MSRFGIIRTVTALGAALLVLSGVFGAITYGAICSLDVTVLSLIDPVVGPILASLGGLRIPITATCPLGYFERSLAAGLWLPQWWFPVVLILASVLLLGRVFCGWVCPAGLLQRVLPGVGGGKRGGASNGAAGQTKQARWLAYSSYAFLAGTLVASWIFRFPVFCFVCPIGLFFGGAYAVMQIASPYPFSVELVLFPAMLAVELWLLKNHWCRAICPLGAMLSLAGNLNRFFLPTVKAGSCLTSKGINCSACSRACPERIELATIGKAYLPNSCTKCLECVEACPKGAVEIALVR